MPALAPECSVPRGESSRAHAGHLESPKSFHREIGNADSSRVILTTSETCARTLSAPSHLNIQKCRPMCHQPLVLVFGIPSVVPSLHSPTRRETSAPVILPDASAVTGCSAARSNAAVATLFERCMPGKPCPALRAQCAHKIRYTGHTTTKKMDQVLPLVSSPRHLSA